MPRTIRHVLADVRFVYREHVVEVPDRCPSCTRPLQEGAELKEWNYNLADLEAVLLEDGVEACGDAELGDEWVPVALLCPCGHVLAQGTEESEDDDVQAIVFDAVD